MSKIETKCRCCGNKNLKLFLDLQDQPLTTGYHRGYDVPKIPLNINICPICNTKQLSNTVDPDPIYKNHLNMTGHSMFNNRHLETVSKDVMKFWFSKRNKRNRVSVMDIGCNDGTLLQSFEQYNCLIQGVDPAENLREKTKEKRIRVKVGYWGSNTISQSLGLFDIITTIDTINRVDDIHEFMKDSLRCLESNGLIVIEVPYNHHMKKLGIDAFSHDALTYFEVSSLKHIAEVHELKIVRLVKIDQAFNGRIRAFMTKEEEHCPAVEKLINEEENADSSLLAEQLDSLKKLIHKRLESIDCPIVGMYLNAGSNTLINFLDLKLNYIIDPDESKWDYRTPKSEITIKPIEKLEDNCKIIFLDNSFIGEKKLEVKNREVINIFSEYILKKCFLR